AFAIKRHKIEPEIALHGMGGTTSWRVLLPLRRRDHVLISLAGPFAGFLFGVPFWAFLRFAPVNVLRALPEEAFFGLRQLIWVNFGWGLINLLPVLPFDGGHVLEHALGPKRARATAVISMCVGIAVAVFFIKQRAPWGALIFGLGALQSFQRLRNLSP